LDAGAREIEEGIYRVGVTDPDREVCEEITPLPDPVQPAF